MSGNNKEGINQYPDCSKKDNESVNELIIKYHRAGVTNRVTISELLLAEGFKISAPTVARRFKILGLKSAAAAAKSMSAEEARQLIFDQMSKDPNRRQGPSLIKEKIARNTGIHLKRSLVREEMRLEDPEGFLLRDPNSQKVKRGVLIHLGPNHEWSADGHDKLAALGFGIWGVRDVWSAKWLGLWVVPNNRLMEAVAWLYLSLVCKRMPIQSTTDCGSETTLIYGLANALREAFAPELAEANVSKAHRFLKSIYNITIERGWLYLRLTWVDNAKLFMQAGSDIYDSSDPVQYELYLWIWSTLIQKELDNFRAEANDHKIRSDPDKMNPSGGSPNLFYTLPTKYNGQKDCLQPVDVAIVEEMMEDDVFKGGEATRFVSVEYAIRAQHIFEMLNLPSLTFQNVWTAFQAMLPYMAM